MMQFIHDNWGTIATALLGVSEALSLIPGVKSNGIVMAVVNFMKSALSPSSTQPKA